MLLILVEERKVQEILGAVVNAGRLDEPARGIAFVQSVDEVTGIFHRESSE